MIFAISVMRTRGKARPQNDVRQDTPVIGNVVVGSHDSTELGRMSDTATIHTSGGPEPLPPLYDARLAWMGPMGAVLSGLEIINGIAYAQSWWIRAL